MEPIYEQCKEKLEAERDELQTSIAELGDEDPGLTDLLRETLAEVTDALAKLERGTYAICETCNGKIAFARIFEMPAIRQCITCAGEQDPEATMDV
jgi:RNA polymerase-binding transcription factor DksA